MPSRRNFMQASAVAGAGLVATQLQQPAYAKEGVFVMDKLTDASGKYVAGPLPFTYDALEPVIDARTVELHYNFHHKPAVAAANKTEEALAKARQEALDNALVAVRILEAIDDSDEHPAKLISAAASAPL